MLSRHIREIAFKSLRFRFVAGQFAALLDAYHEEAAAVRARSWIPEVHRAVSQLHWLGVGLRAGRLEHCPNVGLLVTGLMENVKLPLGGPCATTPEHQIVYF